MHGRFRGLAYELEHGLRDSMVMHSFYCGLTMRSKSYMNGQSGKTFMELTAANAHILLDSLLLENKIKISLEKLGTPKEPFDDRYELYNLYEEETQVDEVKILSDKLLNLY
jgi:hypothetical protein